MSANRLRRRRRQAAVFRIATFNCRGLASEERLVALETELERVHFDLLGLCSTRRHETGHVERLHSGLHFYHSGDETDGPTFTGVGFLVPDHTNRLISRVRPVNDRIIQLELRLPNGRDARVTQVYAPTTEHSDDDYEDFLDGLRQALTNGRRFSEDIVVGDFNAQVGRNAPSGRYVGRQCLGRGNQRGGVLVDFAVAERLLVANSIFRKPPSRRWTWHSRGLRLSCELDYVLTRTRATITDVHVVGGFDGGSDHRMLRAVLQLPPVRRPRRRPHRLTPDYDPLKLQVRLLADPALRAPPLPERPTADQLEEEWRRLRDALRSAAEFAEKRWDLLPRVSDRTRRLLEERRRANLGRGQDPHAAVAYSTVCKAARWSLRDDLHRHHRAVFERAIQANRLKRGREEMLRERRHITQLRRPDGTLTTTTADAVKVAAAFYKELYAAPTGAFSYDPPASLVQPLAGAEIRDAARRIRGNTAPGADGVRSKAAKIAAPVLADRLAAFTNAAATTGHVPIDFAHASTIVLHKSGDRTEISNYRPISLLPCIYKVVTRALTQRIEGAAGSKLPPEQAGFRRSFSTADHLQAANQLLEKAQEYHFPLVLLFVDLRKAFDSVSLDSIWAALDYFEVDESTKHTIQALYAGGTSSINLAGERAHFDVQRGVRQGDALSPLVFVLVLQHALDRIQWDDGEGVDIGGRRLHLLAYADDIALVAHDPAALQSMAAKLHAACSSVGLEVNCAKTKWMNANRDDAAPTASVSINGQPIERVDKFVYLGQVLQFPRDHSKEAGRRIGAAWAAFGRMKRFLVDKRVAMPLKRRFFNAVILPTMLYGAETWAATESTFDRLAKTQRAMERRMLGVRLRDQKPAAWVRSLTQVTDVVAGARRRKWRFAGKILRTPPGDEPARWSHVLTKWTPPTKRKLGDGRPRTRWEDDIRKHCGHHFITDPALWMPTADDAREWTRLGRTFDRPQPPRRRRRP